MSWISVELGVVGVLMILWLCEYPFIPLNGGVLKSAWFSPFFVLFSATAAYVSSFGTLNCDSVLLEDCELTFVFSVCA